MRTLVLLTVSLLSAASAFGGTLTYTGTTVGGPTWNRPVAGNPPTPPASGVGTAVPFHLFGFFVDTTGSYSIQSTATNPPGWDNYTFLYQTSFSAGSPFTNILVGNDDNPTIGLSGFTRNLTAGTTYWMVTTGFGNSDAGAFSNEIRGPGEIYGGVPEPSTVLLLGAGLAAIGIYRRRRAA